ncbi:hypothetical protein FRC17_003686 [Serendipita sp. 399]|nr:hypothetical protein FRC17_003686 [Serendipita sp. 399]
MAGWGNFGMAELVEKKSTYLEVYQHADLFQPTLEHRKIDFARFAGIRVIVPGHRHQVNMKNIALEQDDDSDPEFVIPPLDMDGLYDKIEAKRTKHLKKYPLEKARPDPGAILARP